MLVVLLLGGAHARKCSGHPPVQPWFTAAVDVAPRVRAKVALDQVRQRHQKTLRELSPEDVMRITAWVTPWSHLGVPTAEVPSLRRTLRRTGNTAPAQDSIFRCATTLDVLR